MNMIEVQHVTKDYGNHKGVFDISFSVEEGEVFGFLGPNGAGKTTTIRQLMGFIKPQQGHVSIMGCNCFSEREKVQRVTGYLPGEIALMDEMTGTEFLRFTAKWKGIGDFGRAEELIRRFELDPSGKIRKMSKGTKQKLGIISAFMGSPKVLLLDEPTSGLDPLMQNQFIDLILEEKKKGTTVLLSSHIFEEIERTCDRTAIIRSGEIVAVEDIRRFGKNAGKIVTAELKDEEEAGLAAKGISGAFVHGKKVEIQNLEDMDALIKYLSRFTVMDLSVRSRSLEEIFLHFYGKE